MGRNTGGFHPPEAVRTEELDCLAQSVSPVGAEAELGGLDAMVRDYLADHPTLTWDQAVARLAKVS